MRSTRSIALHKARVARRGGPTIATMTCPIEMRWRFCWAVGALGLETRDSRLAQQPVPRMGSSSSDHDPPALYDLYPGACTHVPSVPKNHPHGATGDLRD